MKRRSFALRYCSCVALTAISLVGTARAADVVANPGPFHAVLTAGAVSLTGLPTIAIPTSPPSTLDGTIDANGNVTIPSAGFRIAAITVPITTANSSADAQLVSTHPATGQLDPSTGQFGFRLRGRFKVSGPLLREPNCFIGPIDVNRLSTSGAGGSAYDSSTGNVIIGNATFPIPPADPSACGQQMSSLMNALMHLPAAAGSSRAVFSLRVDPPIRSGGGSIASGVADHEEGEGAPPDNAQAVPATAVAAAGASGTAVAKSTNSASETTAAKPRAQIAEAIAYFDRGRAWISVGCSAASSKKCRGSVVVRSIAGRRLGRAAYTVPAGEVSAISVRIRLSRSARRRAKSAPMLVSLTGNKEQPSFLARPVRLVF